MRRSIAEIITRSVECIGSFHILISLFSLWLAFFSYTDENKSIIILVPVDQIVCNGSNGSWSAARMQINLRTDAMMCGKWPPSLSVPDALYRDYCPVVFISTLAYMQSVCHKIVLLVNSTIITLLQ